MEPWKVVILCWMFASIGFVVGAAWRGLFVDDREDERPEGEAHSSF